MQTVKDISEFQRKVHSPLEINGVNVHDLSLKDPEAAYRLVYEAIDRRGGFKPFFEHRNRQNCVRKAMSKPLPGAAASAFLEGAVKVGDYAINEVMPIHLKCLQLVNSPLLDLVSAAITDGKEAKREIEFEDEWNLCLIFTENPETLYDKPKSELLKYITDKAKSRFKMANSATVNGICAAIVKQFERHIATTVRYASDVEGGAEKKSQ
jgi:hypothetical protein